MSDTLAKIRAARAETKQAHQEFDAQYEREVKAAAHRRDTLKAAADANLLGAIDFILAADDGHAQPPVKAPAADPTPAPAPPPSVETPAARREEPAPAPAGEEVYDRAPNPTLPTVQAEDPWPEAPTKPVQRPGRGKPPTTTTPPTTTPPAAPVTNGAADGGLF
jgi:hypothetical protein